MGVCEAVYFWLCIDLMHITPPVTANGYDGSHHPKYAEYSVRVNVREIVPGRNRSQEKSSPNCLGPISPEKSVSGDDFSGDIVPKYISGEIVPNFKFHIYIYIYIYFSCL